MSSLYCLCLVLIAVNSVFAAENAAELFEKFKLEHGKIYAHPEEELRRQRIFAENLNDIEEHNNLHKLGQVSWTKGINQFSDLTPEEFQSNLKITLSHENELLASMNHSVIIKKSIGAPASIDWRARGKVTRVKNQGSCGSCVAFAVVAAIESANAIKRGSTETFSEQQLIDCSKPYKNNGCSGLSFTKSYNYIQDKGLESDRNYPYVAKDDNCKYNGGKVAVRVRSRVIFSNDENRLKEAVGNVGPVSVAFDASALQSYSGGIITTGCKNPGVNHAVLFVGYGRENGVDYWIAKNSWGDRWGEKGFFRIARGRNMCNILHENAYPVL